MRAAFILTLLAFLCPAAAHAQSTPAPTAPSAAAQANPARGRGGDLTRDEYIQRAVDRARRSAEARFDRLDTDHDGVLTADERRAARAARRSAQ